MREDGGGRGEAEQTSRKYERGSKTKMKMEVAGEVGER